MCFIEKMNCIWIRKREDCVSDPIRTSGQVGSSTGVRALTHLVVSKPRFRQSYKIIFEIVCDMH